MFNLKTLNSTFHGDRTVFTKVTAYKLNKSKKTNKQENIPFLNQDNIYNRTTTKTHSIQRKKIYISKFEYLFKKYMWTLIKKEKKKKA